MSISSWVATDVGATERMKEEAWGVARVTVQIKPALSHFISVYLQHICGLGTGLSSWAENHRDLLAT